MGGGLGFRYRGPHAGVQHSWKYRLSRIFSAAFSRSRASLPAQRRGLDTASDADTTAIAAKTNHQRITAVSFYLQPISSIKHSHIITAPSLCYSTRDLSPRKHCTTLIKVSNKLQRNRDNHSLEIEHKR